MGFKYEVREVAPPAGYTFGVDKYGFAFSAAAQTQAQEFLRHAAQQPARRAGVPRPAATTRMLRVAVDVRCNAEWLDLVFEHIGKGLRAVDGVDE